MILLLFVTYLYVLTEVFQSLYYYEDFFKELYQTLFLRNYAFTNGIKNEFDI